MLYLERIERLDPQLNAFRKVMAERALVDAQQADGRRGAGDERPLLGVPIAVKDVEDVTGEVTSWGTAANFTPASQDSELVRRLRAAGAVVIGKTNLPEGAIMGDTEGPAFGITRNPWNTDRSAGGSSGGSAAAVAAGLCAGATASDGAGSIRIPASNCGLVGLKPTRDRIPLAPLKEHWYGMSVAGFEARSVEDAALLMSVGAADEDLRDAFSAAPGRLRVAVSTKPALPAASARRREAGRGRDRRPAALARARGRAERPALPAAERRPSSATSPASRRTWTSCTSAPTGSSAAPRASAASATRSPARCSTGRCARTTTSACGPSSSATTCCSPRSAPCRRCEPASGRGSARSRTLLGMIRAYPFALEWNLTGQPSISVPVGGATTASRSACSSWAATARRPPCWRSPRSSRASCAGPSFGRLSR